MAISKPKKNKDDKTFDLSHENIITTEFSEEMKQSFLDYSMSVLISRAVPDIRDGLKPVHRRILNTMKELNLTHDKAYKKSANVVGKVLADFHPHGDASVYEAMVNLSHDFSLNTPFVDGHGNFGSIEGDAFASSRYTEARLQKYAEDVMLEDLNKDVVDYMENYDNTKFEPVVLPAKIPNVLINGTNGIAVGTTTSTPPHNLTNVIDTYIKYINNNKISIDELIKTIIGPDFPTGGIIINKSDLSDIYKTGQGKIKVRGKVVFEPSTGKSDHDKLVITEIPYTMVGLGIEKFLSDVAELAKSKVLPEVYDIMNQTSSNGIRLVIELKNGSNAERVENILYKKTKLEDTIPVNMLYVVDQRPITINLKQVFENFGKFHFETKTRKYNAILNKNKEVKEIKEGLIIAIDMIDAIIETLRGSNNIIDAKNCLMGISNEKVKFKTKTSQKIASKFSFTELQAQAILDMKLSRLINLELNQLVKEKTDAEKNIAKCEKILSSKREMNKIIVSELENIKNEYGRERRTKIIDTSTPDVDLNIVVESDVILCYDKFGYIKLFDIPTYERNKDAINESLNIFQTKSTDTLFVFTNKGQLHQIKVKDIPFCKFKDRGTVIDNLCNYNSSTEHFITILPSNDVLNNKFVCITSDNYIKITQGNDFITTRKTIDFTKLSKDATIIGFGIVPKILIIQSKNNFFLNIDIPSIPEQKRASIGSKCMNLKEEDELVNVYFLSEKEKEFIVNESKATIKLSRITKQKRATAGKQIKM